MVRNFLTMLNNLQQMSQLRVIRKTAESTGDLTGNKVAY